MNFMDFKKLLIYLSIIPVIFFLLSCSNDYCNQITGKIKNKYRQGLEEEAVLDLNEVFEFEWDVLYVCGPYGFDQEISDSIGFETQYDYVVEGETLFSFIKDNKVVEERLISCNGIGFVNDNEEKSECLEIKSSNAKFKIKNLSKDGQNYILRKMD